MLKTSILSTLFIVTLLMQGCGNDTKTETTTKEVQKANSMISSNEYILSDLNSSQHIVIKEKDGFSLEGAKGKVVIFDIFATWCPPCRAAASHLSSLQAKYKDDLVIVGLTIENDISNAKLQEFLDEKSADYMLVNSSVNRRLVDDIATHLKVGERFPIPLMALYKDGVLINHYVGAIQEEFIESDIKRALKK